MTVGKNNEPLEMEEINKLLGIEPANESADESANEPKDEDSDKTPAGEFDVNEEDEDGDDKDADDADDAENAEPADKQPSIADDIEAIKQRMAELTESIKPASDDVSKNEQDPVAPVMDEMPEIDLFADGIDDIMEDKEVFQEWFSSTIQKIRAADRDSIMTMVYKNIPGIIQKHVIEQVEGKASASKFYEEHSDLVEHKKEVAKMAQVVKESFPELDKKEFFIKVADMTRNMLGLEQTVKNKATEKPGKKPALNNKSVRAVSKRSAGEELAGMEKEISDLINLM